jgi:endonuclease/exonuclease/phosphatase family metal-dependent hydrolase
VRMTNKDIPHTGGALLAVLLAAGAGCSSDADLSAAALQTQEHAVLTPDFKLMTYNIKNAYASNPHLGDPSMADFADTIVAEDPDVVALQEIASLGSGDYYDGSPWRDYDNIYYEQQIRTLSELTGMPYYAFSATGDRAHAGYIDIWDATMGVSARTGVGILSKYPFVGDPEIIDLARDENNATIFPITASNRDAIVKVTVELPADGGTMLADIYSVHLSSDPIRRSEQGHDIDRLAHPTRPAFLMGDMNARKDELDTLPGWLDPRIGSGEYLAYPSWDPEKQIDWILYRNIQAFLTLDAYVAGGTDSDHQAWIVAPLILAQCATFDPASPANNFCDIAPCPLCLAGQGDCDSAVECAPGLVCSTDAGAAYGLPADYDVCEIPPATITVPQRIQETFPSTGPASIYPLSHTYAIEVTTEDTYSVKLRYATTATNRFATLYVDGRPHARKLLLEDTGAWSTFAETTFKHLPLAAGNHVLQIQLDGDGVNVDWVDVFVSNIGPFGQIPWTMPAFIQAEDFNVGGASAATAGNAGGVYRFGEDLDVYTKESHLQDEGGYRVVFGPGDWAEYNVDAEEADSFRLSLRYATAFGAGARVRVSVDGVNASSSLTLPQTFSGGAPAYETFVFPDEIAFDEGVSTVRITSTGTAGFSLDTLSFAREWTGPVPGVPWPVPGIIEAENYDLVDAWSDATSGNDGSVLRWEDVDLWFGASNIGNDHFVWATAAGEWLEYTIDVAATDTYDIQVRYATTFAGKSVSFLCDGAPITGSIALAPTCGWGSDGTCWAIATASGVAMSAGTHVLRLVMNTGLHNVDYIDIETSP